MSDELARYLEGQRAALARLEADLDAHRTRALSGRVVEAGARTPMTVRLGPLEREALAFLAARLGLEPGAAMRETMVREARAAGWSAEPGG